MQLRAYTSGQHSALIVLSLLPILKFYQV
jgi:hypothetical protein